MKSHQLLLIVMTIILGNLFAIENSSAQSIFGLKAGMTVSDVRTDFTGDLGEFSENTMPFVSPHFGLFAQLAFSKRLYFQPELLYFTKGFQASTTDINGMDGKTTTRFQSFSMPLLLGVRLQQLNIAMGPEIEYLTQATVKAPGSDPMDHPVYEDKKWLINANLEVGYQINRFKVGVRGSLGLTPLAKLNFTDVNGEAVAVSRISSLALQASIAYRLFSHPG